MDNIGEHQSKWIMLLDYFEMLIISLDIKIIYTKMFCSDIHYTHETQQELNKQESIAKHFA